MCLGPHLRIRGKQRIFLKLHLSEILDQISFIVQSERKEKSNVFIETCFPKFVHLKKSKKTSFRHYSVCYLYFPPSPPHTL